MGPGMLGRLLLIVVVAVPMAGGCSGQDPAVNSGNPADFDFHLRNLLLCQFSPNQCHGGSGVASAPITEVYLFSNASTTSGGLLGPRTTADSLCASERSGVTFPNNACQNVRMVISLNAGDTIAMMPTNFALPASLPVHGPGGIVVAPNWTTFVNGTLTSTLSAAAVIGVYWWTFSTGTGDFNPTPGESCTNGTAPGDTGTAGAWNVTNGHISNLASRACTAGNSAHVCVCY